METRYFFVSYFANSDDHDFGFGNIYYSSQDFLRHDQVCELIRKERKTPDMNPVILNMLELSQEDYEAFLPVD